MMVKKPVNRREFLRLGAIATAGVGLAACGAQPAATPAEAPAEAPAEEAAAEAEEAAADTEAPPPRM